MKCVYREECPNTGEPMPGSDAFICSECIAMAQKRALEAWAEFRKKVQRHQNN
jgi:hypothetical protein